MKNYTPFGFRPIFRGKLAVKLRVGNLAPDDWRESFAAQVDQVAHTRLKIFRIWCAFGDDSMNSPYRFMVLGPG